METTLVMVGGLMARLFLFVLLFVLFATPIVAAVYAVQGVVALRRRATGTVDAGGARWKPGIAYTGAHTWVKSLWGRTVKVGLDDVARRLVSGVSSLTLPPVGSKLRRGDLLVAARCGDRLVAVPSPVDGTEFDFRDMRPVGETTLDHCFTDLERGDDGLARVTLSSPEHGASTTLWADDAYPYLMLYTGDDRPDVSRRSLAVEPMTCPPQAFRSGEAVITLEPGDSVAAGWGLSRA